MTNRLESISRAASIFHWIRGQQIGAAAAAWNNGPKINADGTFPFIFVCAPIFGTCFVARRWAPRKLSCTPFSLCASFLYVCVADCEGRDSVCELLSWPVSRTCVGPEERKKGNWEILHTGCSTLLEIIFRAAVCTCGVCNFARVQKSHYAKKRHEETHSSFGSREKH